MTKLEFSVDINAPKDRVWQVLWDDASYREWTRVFHEGSYAETDNWKEGSTVKFLGGDGKSGMYARVVRNIPPEYMSFEHLGEIQDGKEQPPYPASGKENYTLRGNGNGTTLVAELDAPEDFEQYFKDTFPKALKRVKELSEG